MRPTAPGSPTEGFDGAQGLPPAPAFLPTLPPPRTPCVGLLGPPAPRNMTVRVHGISQCDFQCALDPWMCLLTPSHAPQSQHCPSSALCILAHPQTPRRAFGCPRPLGVPLRAPQTARCVFQGVLFSQGLCFRAPPGPWMRLSADWTHLRAFPHTPDKLVAFRRQEGRPSHRYRGKSAQGYGFDWAAEELEGALTTCQMHTEKSIGRDPRPVHISGQVFDTPRDHSPSSAHRDAEVLQYNVKALACSPGPRNGFHGRPDARSRPSPQVPLARAQENLKPGTGDFLPALCPAVRPHTPRRRQA